MKTNSDMRKERCSELAQNNRATQHAAEIAAERSAMLHHSGRESSAAINADAHSTEKQGQQPGEKGCCYLNSPSENTMMKTSPEMSPKERDSYFLYNDDGIYAADVAAFRAIKFYALGFIPVPCFPETKQASIGWKRLMNKRPTMNAVARYFAKVDRESEVAIIMGHEMLDGTFIVAIDYDNQRDFERMAKKWAGKTLIVKSKRGGHIYFRTREAAKSKNNGNWEIKGVGTYVMAPFSHHPNGGFYILHENSVCLSECPEKIHLLSKDEEQELEIERYELPRVHLKSGHWFVLNGYVSEATGTDMSANEYKVVVYLLANYPDLTFQQLCLIFEKLAAKNTHYARHRNPQSWLLNAYNKAKSYLESGGDIEFKKKMAWLYKYAEECPWNWSSGRTMKYVYLCFLKRALQAGSLENISLSLNEVCAMTGISSKPYAMKIIGALRRAGLIKKIKDHGLFTACEYNINPRPNVLTRGRKWSDDFTICEEWSPETEITVPSSPAIDKDGREEGRKENSLLPPQLYVGLQQLHPTFSSTTRGRACGIILFKFSYTYQPLSEIRKKSGLHKSTFRKYLRWLVDNGLVEIKDKMGRLVERGKDFFDDLGNKTGGIRKQALVARRIFRERVQRCLQIVTGIIKNPVFRQTEIYNRITGEQILVVV